MSENLRKKIVFATLPLAIIWAAFNWPAKKTPLQPEVPMVPPQVVVPTPTHEPNPTLIDIERERAEPWGLDPFRTYTYRNPSSKTRNNQLTWVLGGIIYSNTKPVAFINKRSVQIGDKVGEATVVAIEKHSVTLEYQGRRIKLNLYKG